MDPLLIAVIVAVFTLIVLFSGIPIAFGLSFVSIALLVAFEGFQMLDVFAETFYAGLNSFVLLSIPMFILMGMAVANSPAGKDLYTGLDRWLWRVPGGLVISNIGACSVFAALSGSSPAKNVSAKTSNIWKPSNETKRTIDTKLKPNAIGIPEKSTTSVKTATIIAIINGSINSDPYRQLVL